MYHSITKGSKKPNKQGRKHYLGLHLDSEKFEHQIRYLSAEYNLISLDHFIESIADGVKLPSYSVVITFDDGYLDNYTHAFPILKSLKIPATIFLTTNFIGGKNAFWWDKMEYAIRNTERQNIELSIDGRKVSLSLGNLKDKINALTFITKCRVNLPEEEGRSFIEEVTEKLGVDLNEVSQKEENYQTLDWDKIKVMKNNGISFGAHTASHVILTRCSSEKAEKEIGESKERIEGELGEECRWFAYPNGNFDKAIKEAVRVSGFSCALTTIQGMNDLRTDPYEIRRIAISNTDDFLSFLGKVTGTTFFLLSLRNRLLGIFSGKNNKCRHKLYPGLIFDTVIPGRKRRI